MGGCLPRVARRRATRGYFIQPRRGGEKAAQTWAGQYYPTQKSARNNSEKSSPEFRNSGRGQPSTYGKGVNFLNLNSRNEREKAPYRACRFSWHVICSLDRH